MKVACTVLKGESGGNPAYLLRKYNDEMYFYRQADVAFYARHMLQSITEKIS